MRKKMIAALLVSLLALALFSLPAAAAPSAQDMAVLTPYSLAADPFLGQNGAAILTFKIDVPDALPGLDMAGGDDIHVKVEYRLGSGAWVPCFDYSSRRMLEQHQVEPGVYRLPFAWVLGSEWDGVEPVFIRVYCEYMRGGSMGTGIISGYSNEALIGTADPNRPTVTKAQGPEITKPAVTTAAPPPGNTKPTESAAAPEPGAPEPAEENSGAFAISRAAMLSIGIGLMAVLLLGAALVVVFNKKKKK